MTMITLAQQLIYVLEGGFIFLVLVFVLAGICRLVLRNL